MINDSDATVQETTAANGVWHFRMLFPEKKLPATGEYTDENGIDFNVAKIYGPNEFKAARYNFTELEHETLAMAAREEYYEIPREIDTQELAGKLGISHQALSEQFRRASKIFG